MSRITPKTMPGVLELLPPEQCAFEAMLAKIRAGYERFGFLPVETPAIELRDVLLTKSGGETEKQVYFVQSTGSLAQGEPPKLALRFDLTVPLARYVAEHEHDLAFPFRRYQIQRVWRGESAQRGRFREFYQCDIDVVGRDSLPLGVDAEIAVVVDSVFRSLDVGEITIDISNRRILRGVLAAHGVEGDTAAAVLREIDKLDKRGIDAVARTLAEGPFGLDDASLATLLEVVALRGERAPVVDALRALGIDDPGFELGVDELDAVMRAIDEYGVDASRYRANLAIARGLDYYTGTVYETKLDAHPEIGSVCSGGRYDDLASLYTKSKLPGVGISIGATRLFDQLRAAGLLDAGLRSPTRVFVTRLDPSLDASYRRIASVLRAGGINTEVSSQDAKLGKQLKHAAKAGIRFAVIQGPDEATAGQVVLKDLERGEQETIDVASLVGRVG